jgi:hypothetical protein
VVDESRIDALVSSDEDRREHPRGGARNQKRDEARESEQDDHADPLPERLAEQFSTDDSVREPGLDPGGLKLGVERWDPGDGGRGDFPDPDAIALPGYALHQERHLSVTGLDFAEAILPVRQIVILEACVRVGQVDEIDPELLVEDRLQAPRIIGTQLVLLERESPQVEEASGILVFALACIVEESVHRAAGRSAIQRIRGAHGLGEIQDGGGLLWVRRRGTFAPARRRGLFAPGPGREHAEIRTQQCDCERHDEAGRSEHAAQRRNHHGLGTPMSFVETQRGEWIRRRAERGSNLEVSNPGARF